MQLALQGMMHKDGRRYAVGSAVNGVFSLASIDGRRYAVGSAGHDA